MSDITTDNNNIDKNLTPLTHDKAYVIFVKKRININAK